MREEPPNEAVRPADTSSSPAVFDRLLDTAATELAARIGVTRIAWREVAVDVRERSTIQILEASSPKGDAATVFVKQDHPSDHADGTVERLRTAIELDAEFDAELDRRLRAEGVATESMLAAEPEELIAVRTAVPGRPMSSTRHRVLPARSVLEQVGRAIAVAEQVGQRVDPPFTLDEVADRLHTSVDLAAEALTDARARQIVAAIDERIERLDVTPSCWTHGDVSPSNVMINRRGGVGLIDFSWSPQPTGRDVAQFSARVEIGARVSPSRRVRSAVLRGYLSVSGTSAEAAELALIDRGLRYLRRSTRRNQQWGRRTLVELVPA